MNAINLRNAKQGAAYAEFLDQIYELGKNNDDVAGRVIKTLLESPELS